MPVYVPNYKNDIFVSYAHVDNEPWVGTDKGWVTTLISQIKILLKQQLGRADAFTLWMDYKLRGNESVTPDIDEQLHNSALLLLILSPGYLASRWCRYELTTFLTKAGKNSGRVFMIEKNRLERPPELGDLLGYPFWTLDERENPRTLAVPCPQPNEPEYYRRVDDLARELAGKLQHLKQTDSPSISIPLQSTTFPTIFLAEVSTDLDERRYQLKRYLDQHNIPILPNRRYSPTNLQAELDEDLQHCTLFIQLLSGQHAQGYPQFQYDRAKALGLPILQWRELTLNLNNIELESQRKLLESPTVIASSLVEFQTQIAHYLHPQPSLPSPPKLTGTWVFLNASPLDKELSQQIENVLENQEIAYSLPLIPSTNTTPTELRQDLEENLLYCDAVIILYGQTSVVWVREQLRYCRRMQGQRSVPLKLILVYNQLSSPSKLPLNMNLPNLRLLESAELQPELLLNLLHSPTV